MKLKSLILTFFLFLGVLSFSQYDPDYSDDQEYDINELSFKDRLFTGGNFWASFGQISSVEISPILGYRITKDFSAGVGLKYNWFRQNLTPAFTTSMFGGSTFARYTFFNRIVTQAEFEVLNLEVFNSFTSSERKWVPIGLVGGGYAANGFQLMLMYDLIGNENNPYIGMFGPNSRIYLRAGFLISL